MRSIVILASLLAFASAQAQSLRASITTTNTQVANAMKKKDFAALNKAIKGTVTPNFVYVENGQKQNVDQMLANMKMGIGMMKKVTVAQAKVLSLKEKGNTGVAKAQHTIGGLIPGPDGKTQTMVVTGTVEETYVKQGGKWKMSKMHWLSQKMTMNGKPFDPAAMGGGR
jgi:ketosteroid isomerase-like protein